MPAKGPIQVPISREQAESFEKDGTCVLAEELGNFSVYHWDVRDGFFLSIGQICHPVIVVGKQLKNLDEPSGPAFIIVSKVAVRP